MLVVLALPERKREDPDPDLDVDPDLPDGAAIAAPGAPGETVDPVISAESLVGSDGAAAPESSEGRS